MRFLIAVPVLIVLIAFALSNQQVVRLGLWPTDITLDAPLSVTVLVAAGLFFICGALMTWGGGLVARSRAKRAERKVQQLQTEIQAMRSRSAVPGPGMSGPGIPGAGVPGSALALPPPGA